MTYKIDTLESQSIETLCEAINICFEDYIIEINMTPLSLKQRFDQYNVDLSHSVGVFADNVLVGFIINSFENGSLFNSMTAIAVEHRGHRLFTKMLDHFKKNKIYKNMSLEVSTSNPKALNMYKNNGFEYVDTLHIFEIDEDFTNTHHAKHTYSSPHTLLQSYGNQIEAIQRIKDSLKCIHTQGALCYIQANGNILYSKTQSVDALIDLYKICLGHFKRLSLQNVSSSEVVIINALLSNKSQEIMTQYLMHLNFE